MEKEEFIVKLAEDYVVLAKFRNELRTSFAKGLIDEMLSQIESKLEKKLEEIKIN